MIDRRERDPCPVGHYADTHEQDDEDRVRVLLQHRKPKYTILPTYRCLRPYYHRCEINRRFAISSL